MSVRKRLFSTPVILTNIFLNYFLFPTYNVLLHGVLYITTHSHSFSIQG